ncbi:MAG: APC family permease [Acidimicrobiia bacterium]|nr:APC family permease [Acidimicrobiia bacterium]
MTSKLNRSLGLLQVTASGVGIIVGAGIYALLGAATKSAGGVVWMSFGAAGLLSALTALSYAELSSMYPSAGAEFEYTRHVAPAFVAFVVGWMMILGLVVAGGAVALGFAGYFRHFVDVPAPVVAVGLLVAMGGIATLGIERAARLTVVLSVLQVAGLVAVIIVGAPHLGDYDLVGGASVGRVLGGAALVFFAFIGFDEVITLAAETRDPARTVPRALLIALAISTALYMAVGVAAVSVLGPNALAESATPLADVMHTAIGSASSDAMAIAAMIATINTTLLVVTAASRLTWSMATVGTLPPALRVLNRRQVPARAIGLAVMVAAGCAAMGRIALVAGVTDFAVFLVFVAVNATVIGLRFRQPNHRRPFRVPWSIGKVPVPAVFALLTVGAVVPSLEPAAIGWGSFVLLVGVVAYGLMRRRPAVVETIPGADDPMTRRTQVAEAEALRAAELLAVDFDAVEFDLAQFRQGLERELQHGRADPDTNVTDDDLVVTAKIALAHLNEIPDYYSRLEVMEAQAIEEWKHR